MAQAAVLESPDETVTGETVTEDTGHEPLTPATSPLAGGADPLKTAQDKEAGVISGLTQLRGESNIASEAASQNVADVERRSAARLHEAWNAEASTSRDIPSWNEQQQKEKFATDPVKAFGSMGSVFAMVAAAFTHRPMINALQGSAAAMDATREGDEKAYKDAYTAWKDNTELALKRHDMMRQEFQDANALAETDLGAAKAQQLAIAQKYDDKRRIFLLQNGLDEDYLKLEEMSNKSAEELRKHVNSIQEDTFADTAYKSMLSNIDKAFEGRPKDDPQRLSLMAEAARRRFIGKTTTLDDEQWQEIAQWEMQHVKDNNGKGPTAEERQKFYQGFRTSIAHETPDMEFLRKYQEEHPEAKIEDAEGALQDAKNASRDRTATARQAEIDRHNQAVETISAGKGDTSAGLAKEKERHDKMTEALQYSQQELTDAKLRESIRTNTVKAQGADARQEEIDRHNRALETLTGNRGDITAKLADEKERHDKAMEDFSQQRLSAAKLPTSAGEKVQAVEDMLKDNPGMKREEAIGAVDARIAKAVADAKGSNALLDDDTVSIMADQYMAGDKSVLQNLGRGAQGAQNIVKIRDAVMRKAKEQGLKGEDLALRMAEFNGLTAGQRTLGARTANVEMFANETLNMIDVARKASVDVPRSQWIPANKALQAFESNTGDPKIRAFGASINSLVNTYAKAIAGGGQATVSDKDHAREIITSADSQAQFDAVMNIIEKELKAAREAPGQVKQQFRDLAGSNSLDKPLAPEQNIIKYDINGKRIP